MGISQAEIAKYGGSSLYTPETIGQAIDGTRHHIGEQNAVIVVTSASYRTTNRLHEAINAAIEGQDYKAILFGVGQMHEDLIGGMGSSEESRQPIAILDREIADLTTLLDSVNLIGEAASSVKDRIISSGERINTPIVTGYARTSGINATYVPANEVVVTDNKFGAASPDVKKTRQNLRKRVMPLFEKGVVVYVGGYEGAFIFRGRRISTTFGRGGSDETATLLAESLNDFIPVNGVFLYKAGVGGIMTANPDIVTNPMVNPHMTYREVAALSGIGGSVIHSKAIQHVETIGVPLHLRSTQNPKDPGTLVDGIEREDEPPVKAVTYRDDLPYLVVEGAGMDQPDVAATVTSALGNSDWDINFIAQASEQAMAFALEPKADIYSVENDVRSALAKKFSSSDVAKVHVGTIAKIGVIGVGANHPASKEKIYRGLQGTDEYPVNPSPKVSASGDCVESVLLAIGDGENAPNAVRAIHSTIFS